MNRAAALVLVALIRCYQAVVSPWVSQQCKYYPSCSAYGLTAIQTHGALHGTRLTVWRILRCNPWSDGGVDHVPTLDAEPDDAPAVQRAHHEHAVPATDLART